MSSVCPYCDQDLKDCPCPHDAIADLRAQVSQLEGKVKELLLERDEYERQAKSRWMLREELEKLAGLSAEETATEEGFKKALDYFTSLRAENEKMKQALAWADEELSRLKTGKESQLVADLAKTQEECARLREELEQRKRAPDFWKDIVVKDGTLDIEQVRRELEDYYFVMDQVANVYDHITGGKLSKPNYHAKVVIAEADDFYEASFGQIAEDDARMEVEEELDSLALACAEVREALQFYADKKNYHLEDAVYIDDDGEIARKALAKPSPDLKKIEAMRVVIEDARSLSDALRGKTEHSLADAGIIGMALIKLMESIAALDRLKEQE